MQEHLQLYSDCWLYHHYRLMPTTMMTRRRKRTMSNKINRESSDFVVRTTKQPS